MYAIRCREHHRAFRRGGVLFSGNTWTFQDDATPAQLAEPMLLCVEVEAEDDPRLEEFALPVPEIAPAANEEGAPSDFDVRVRNEHLERANAELTNQVAQQQGQLVCAFLEIGRLQEEIRVLTSPTIQAPPTVPDAPQEAEASQSADVAPEALAVTDASETPSTPDAHTAPPAAATRTRSGRIVAPDAPPTA